MEPAPIADAADPVDPNTYDTPHIEGYPIDTLDEVAASVKPVSVVAAVREAYRRSAGAYIWTDGRRLTTSARRLVWMLDTVRDHGIEPRMLDARGTLALVDTLGWVQGLLKQSPVGAADHESLVNLRTLLFARLDARLTGAALALARVFGHTDAGGAELAHVLPPVEGLDDWIYSLLPWFPQYHRLSKALSRYREMPRWTRVPLPERRRVNTDGKPRFESEAWRLGDEDERLLMVRERLAQEGFLPQGAIGKRRFDQALEDAVRAFQYTRGLGVNGEIDRKTARAMNVTRGRLLSDIRDAMTRWRSSRVRHERSFVLVNVPEFTVELYANKQRVRRTKAVVGYAYGSGGGRTKLFHSSIDRVVVNPGWTPSDRLIERELKPKEASNPGWLKRRGFQWFKRPNGRLGLFQSPGDKNALGRVKLSFPNDYNIYLHGSPNAEQFDLANRAQSNGCVRVEDVESLTREVLQVSDTMPSVEFERLLDSGKTHALELTRPIPVHFEYVRVVVDDDDTIRFLPNVYRL